MPPSPLLPMPPLDVCSPIFSQIRKWRQQYQHAVILPRHPRFLDLPPSLGVKCESQNCNNSLFKTQVRFPNILFVFTAVIETNKKIVTCRFLLRAPQHSLIRPPINMFCLHCLQPESPKFSQVHPRRVTQEVIIVNLIKKYWQVVLLEYVPMCKMSPSKLVQNTLLRVDKMLSGGNLIYKYSTCLKLIYYKKVFFPHAFICQRRFSNEKVGNRKNQARFYYISLKT